MSTDTAPVPTAVAAPAPASSWDVNAWVEALYGGAVDHKDAAGFAAVFAEDAWMRFGNAEPVIGRDAIEVAIAHFFTLFQGLHHDFTAIWAPDDAVILEGDVTYTRFDGSTVSMPFTTILRLTAPGSGIVRRAQMYLDLTPLFAPTSA